MITKQSDERKAAKAFDRALDSGDTPPELAEDLSLARKITEMGNQLAPDPVFTAQLERHLVQVAKNERAPTMGSAHLNWRRAAILALFTLLIAIGALMVTPAGGVLAERVLQFFSQSVDDTEKQTVVRAPSENSEGVEDQPFIVQSDGQVIPVEEEGIVITPPGDLKDTDFPVFMPTFLPEGYSLNKAEYHPLGPMTWVEFTCGRYAGFTLTQNQITYEAYLADPEYRGDIGASAEIIEVDINGTKGEYVQGNWGPTSPFSGSEEVEFTWDPNLNFHRLIWYTDGSLFRITTSRSGPGNEACRLMMEDILTIAESLRPYQ
ncbi:MAG: hypothetical protein PVG14_18570 [Anaerolineales bacterium]|jgi:hypothetical protein